MNRRPAASAARTRARDAAAILAAVVASAAEPQRCPNCPPGYDCEAGRYLTTNDEPTGERP